MTRSERVYYLVFGLYNLSWAFLGPVYAIFLLSRGLNLFEINCVLAVYLVSSFLFEVPTGAVADVFGRKASFLLSCAVRCGAFQLYYWADSLPLFLLAEAIDAVGTTLATGAIDAWAVDGSRAEGDARPADRLFARGQIVARFAMVASGLAGAYAADVDLALPWMLGSGGFVATAIVAALAMREPARGLRSQGAPSWSETMGASLRALRAHPPLRGLCLLTVTGAFATMPAHMMWQPRVEALLGPGVWQLGWIWAALNVAGIVGVALVPWLLRIASAERVLAITCLWRGLTLAVAAMAVDTWPVLLSFVLYDLGFGVTEPVLSTRANDFATREDRATILSLRQMGYTLGGGLGLIVIGGVAEATDIPTAWLVSSGVFVLTAAGFAWLSREPATNPRVGTIPRG